MARTKEEEKKILDNAEATDDEDKSEEEEDDVPPPPPAAATLTQKWGSNNLNRLQQWLDGLPQCFVIILYGIIIIAVAHLFQKFINYNKDNPPPLRLEKYFQDLNSKFPHQEISTMITLNDSMHYMLDDRERNFGQPTIVILIPPSLAQSSFPQCFVESFGKILNEASHDRMNGGLPLPVKVLNSNMFKSMELESINEDMKKYFSIGGRTIVITDIQSFEEKDHLNFFHAVCDNSHYPNKRGIYFFLVKISDEFYARKDSYKNLDSFAFTILETEFKKLLKPEKYHALIPRISNQQPILLNPGDTC